VSDNAFSTILIPSVDNLNQQYQSPTGSSLPPV
jgi:hypothetical protein